MKFRKYIILFILFLFPFMIGMMSQTVHAETALLSPKKVLLVYDSLRKDNLEVEQNIHSLERLLSSMQYQVTSESMNEYKAGQIKKEKYDAVITMINWAQMPLINETFIKDRDAYHGKKLHIGPKLTKIEKGNFPNQWDTLYQQGCRIVDSHKYYDEIIGLKKKLEVPIDVSEDASYPAYLDIDRGKGKRDSYPFGLHYKNNAYLPFYSDEGATFLASSELIAEWLGIKKSYNPYIAILGFSPLSNMKIAEKFAEKIKTIENDVILSAASTSTNNDLQTFKVYVSILKEFTEGNKVVVYLNVPALNNVGDTNNQLLNVMTQEVSAFIEDEIFPLGISAPAYWNFDTFYQNSALNFADATLLYEFDKTPVYHTRTTQALAYPLMFYNIDHKQLENVNWHINGKYTDFTFAMPTTISYNFPTSTKEMNREIKQILNDPFPPTDSYLYHFDTGVSTQTQNIRGKNGVITLNDTPVNNINFNQLKERHDKIEKNTKKMKKQASTTVEKTMMNKLNDVLVGVIVFTLIILIILLVIGRQFYLRMFKGSKKSDQKKETKK